MLPKTMQAVVVHGVEDYRLSEVPVPEIGPGEVLVRVLATGVCVYGPKFVRRSLKVPLEGMIGTVTGNSPNALR